MKNGNAVVMIAQKTPDFQSAAAVVIKSTIHKFDLTNPCAQKDLQVGKDFIKRCGAYPFFNGRQAILALKRTAAGGFVRFYLLRRIAKVQLLGNGKIGQIQRRLRGIDTDRMLCPHGQSGQSMPIGARFCRRK